MKERRPPHGKGWKPIATAPKDGITLLLSRIYHRTVYMGRWSEKWGHWVTFLARGKRIAFDKLNPPTHWQYVPMPPRMWHRYEIGSNHADYLKRNRT